MGFLQAQPRAFWGPNGWEYDPFALDRTDATVPWIDPGPPPMLGTGSFAAIAGATGSRFCFFDGSGLWLCQKRLEKGTFRWAGSDSGESVTLTREELTLLLGGIEFERVRSRNWWRKEV